MLNDYINKKIAVLGLGLENEALIGWLVRQGVSLDLTIYDRRDPTQLADKREKIISLARPLSINWQLGDQSHGSLGGYDEIWRSPGWPIFCPQIKAALLAGCQLNSPMNLFFSLCPTSRIVGITGSKGKGTTSSLIYNIFKLAGYRVFLGGNIGVAPFAFIDQLDSHSWVILELSSFQLEDMKYSPSIAVITNIYEEHLASADPFNPNFHQTAEDYWLAKQQIFRHQTSDNWLIINEKLNNIFDPSFCPSQVKWFNKLNWSSQLVGNHNQENIAAAQAVAELAKIKLEISQQAVADFQGLEHRLEFVGEKDGVRYYDDSFATNPIATTIALNSFNQPVILLAGGADKGNDFGPLAKVIASCQTKAVILFDGQASPRLKQSLLSAGYLNEKIYPANSMDMAMKLAKQLAQAGDVVLLSTACASFGLFNNYKERGNLFKQAV